MVGSGIESIFSRHISPYCTFRYRDEDYILGGSIDRRVGYVGCIVNECVLCVANPLNVIHIYHIIYILHV